MKKIVVSASSMPAGRNMSAQIEYLERITNYGADMYHLDVMDGEFVKNKTLDYTYLEQLKEKSPVLFDCHLMIKNPEKYVDKYIKAGANIVSVHFEAFEDKEVMIQTLNRIKNKGCMASLAVDIDTNISEIKPYLRYLDMVLIMSVKIGKSGQEFRKESLQKVKYIRDLNKNILIEIDGGINDRTCTQAVKAGADILVSGNYIYLNNTYDAIQTLKGKNG